jgi:hypothetical protein
MLKPGKSIAPPPPPKLPATSTELDRAIVLLGSRSRTELNAKARTELVELIGTYPDSLTASVWKKQLRAYLSEAKIPIPSLKSLVSLKSVNPETQILLDWIEQALSLQYLDDEERYDPVFVELMQTWLENSDNNRAAVLGKRFLAASIAMSKLDDPLDFDWFDFEFDFEQDSISANSGELGFVEPLLRLALDRVDWGAIGKYLVETLSLPV